MSIEAMVKPYRDDDMEAWTVSKDANNSKAHRNVPEILQAFTYEEVVKADQAPAAGLF